mmetsp:Transcript_7622/g.30590  ORF Transcript_7622/g.30590 Transcript_7622/m.30590 type:complete len:82 (-) Transcript_7622:1244-1489(-)
MRTKSTRASADASRRMVSKSKCLVVDRNYASRGVARELRVVAAVRGAPSDVELGADGSQIVDESLPLVVLGAGIATDDERS